MPADQKLMCWWTEAGVFTQRAHAHRDIYPETFFSSAHLFEKVFLCATAKWTHWLCPPWTHHTNTPNQYQPFWNTLCSDFMLRLENTQPSTNCVILSSLRHLMGWTLDMTYFAVSGFIALFDVTVCYIFRLIALEFMLPHQKHPTCTVGNGFQTLHL